MLIIQTFSWAKKKCQLTGISKNVRSMFKYTIYLNASQSVNYNIFFTHAIIIARISNKHDI